MDRSHRERQPVHNHARKCSPGTSTPCQKLAVANSTAPSVFLKRSSRTERGAVPATAKETRRAIARVQKIVHLRIAGEQAERPPSLSSSNFTISSAALAANPASRTSGICRGRYTEPDSENRTPAAARVLRVVNAQPLPDVVEAPAHRQRRGSQYDRVELFEQPLPQNLADVDRRRRQEHAFVPPLVPVNEVFSRSIRTETKAPA